MGVTEGATTVAQRGHEHEHAPNEPLESLFDGRFLGHFLHYIIDDFTGDLSERFLLTNIIAQATPPPFNYAKDALSVPSNCSSFLLRNHRPYPALPFS